MANGTPSTPKTEDVFKPFQEEIATTFSGHTNGSGLHPINDAAHRSAAIELLKSDKGKELIADGAKRQEVISALESGITKKVGDKTELVFGGLEHILEHRPNISGSVTKIAEKASGNEMAKRGVVAGALHDFASANTENASVKALLDVPHKPDVVGAHIREAVRNVEGAVLDESKLTSDVLNGTKDAYTKAQKTHLAGYVDKIASSVVKDGHSWTARATESVAARFKHGINPVTGGKLGFMSKAGAGLTTAAGAGLVIHGGKNFVVGFTGTTDKETGEQVGPSFTKSLVGLGEMAGGLATVSRGLTGRWMPNHI